MSVIISGTNGIQNVLGSASSPAESNTSSSNTGLYFPSSTTLGVSTAGTNALYIDASQNVGIGTSSPSYKLSVNGTAALLSGNTLQLNNSSNTGLAKINCTGGGTLSLYSYNSEMLTLYEDSAIIFKVGSGTERMRIDSSGNLLVGYTSSNGSYKLQVNSQIFATSSTIATSDANYKTNVTPLTGALDLVSKLNPVSFNWKQHPVHDFDTQNTTVGFLAQEVQTALSGQAYVNSIIKESEVTLLDETKEKFLGIAEGNMIAILTKAIQELKAEFDAYKAAHP